MPTVLAPVNWSRRVILVTGHRRESFGPPFEGMCRALLRIMDQFPDAEIVYPVHLNPKVQEPVRRLLGAHPRIHLLPPLDYPDLVWLMSRSCFVLTDSGGLQEEAPTFKKPVLVMREVTERLEAIESGVARLVGTSEEGIVAAAGQLLSDPAAYRSMIKDTNPFGDGRAAERILNALETGSADLTT